VDDAMPQQGACHDMDENTVQRNGALDKVACIASVAQRWWR
jgi:hypothetical protein